MDTLESLLCAGFENGTKPTIRRPNLNVHTKIVPFSNPGLASGHQSRRRRLLPRPVPKSRENSCRGAWKQTKDCRYKEERFCNANFAEWSDLFGETCDDYRAKNLCTFNGKKGAHWTDNMALLDKTFADFGQMGFTGLNCPQCGCLNRECADNCWSKNRGGYHGTTNFTKSNIPCLYWNSTEIAVPGGNLAKGDQYRPENDGHNSCLVNMEYETSLPQGPWCYVRPGLYGGKYKTWEYCDIPHCKDCKRSEYEHVPGVRVMNTTPPTSTKAFNESDRTESNRRRPLTLHRKQECSPNFRSWTDSKQRSCEDYRRKGFCTRDGKRGNGWKSYFGTFDKYQNEGCTAANCPQCGCIHRRISIWEGVCLGFFFNLQALPARVWKRT